MNTKGSPDSSPHNSRKCVCSIVSVQIDEKFCHSQLQDWQKRWGLEEWKLLQGQMSKNNSPHAEGNREPDGNDEREAIRGDDFGKAENEKQNCSVIGKKRN